mgnify:FL=1|tara:strand:+ start:549 stop:1316 length:768 start_codon:yes stop_codon:yes gene_type:complete
MLGQYFYNESLRKCIIAFGSLFNDIYITRKNSAGTDVQSLKVPLAYGPKQKFMVRLDADPNLDQKVAITLPRIGFEIAGFDYDPSRKLNRIIKRKKVANTEDKKLKQMSTQHSPVPYNLNFEMFVMTKNSDDGIQIVEQILPFFQPEYTVTIKEVPEMDVVRDVPIVLNSIGYEDTYTGSFTERRAIIYTFSFVAKAYVYGPVTTAKPITKAEATVYADLQDKAPPRVAKVTQQAIGTPDTDDNFGFNETISEWT